MFSYTQNDLSSIWQNIKDGNPAEGWIKNDEKLEQTLEFPTVATYSDSNNSPGPTVCYTRRKNSPEEASWGAWVRKN
jgi:hypothetical protein